jgi:hypothetical protein
MSNGDQDATRGEIRHAKDRTAIPGVPIEIG